jgi:quercetin dioxygenase-like cupin family protein
MIPKHLGPGEGEIIQLLGEPRTFKVTPAENGGTYLQFETSHAPGTAVPPHFHQEEDEAFYVLAGQFSFVVGETHFTATTGAFAFAPRGTVHAFTTIGQEMGRMLITVTPGRQHEGFMREVGEQTERRGSQPELSEVVALALKYGWVVPATGHEH